MAEGKRVPPAETLRGSPGHRPLRGRPPALQIGLVLSPELVQEVVLLQRKRARYLETSSCFQRFLPFYGRAPPQPTFTVWMAPPPRCSLRISITLFSVSDTERRSSRQAATGGQERSDGGLSEASGEDWTGLQRREGEILTQSGSAKTSVTAEGGGKTVCLSTAMRRFYIPDRNPVASRLHSQVQPNRSEPASYKIKEE